MIIYIKDIESLNLYFLTDKFYVLIFKANFTFVYDSCTIRCGARSLHRNCTH